LVCSGVGWLSRPEAAHVGPSQPLPPVPDDTVRIARATFRRGNPYVLLRDKLGALFTDADFADLYPKLGQPAYAPWRLALVTLMQDVGHGAQGWSRTAMPKHYCQPSGGTQP